MLCQWSGIVWVCQHLSSGARSKKRVKCRRLASQILSLTAVLGDSGGVNHRLLCSLSAQAYPLIMQSSGECDMRRVRHRSSHV